MKSILNAASFQLFWFACVLGGDDWALGAAVFYFVFHHYFFVKQNNEWWLVLFFILLGIVIDGALILGGWLQMPPSIWTFPIPPPWLLALWAGVGTLFFHCLSWGQKRPWLLSSLAAFSVPSSYFAGAHLAQVTLAEPLFETLLIMGIIWFLLMQVGIFATQFLSYQRGLK